MPARQPVQIIAHRGASRTCLENTMAAFREALNQGADGIELDVHATLDGVVVVHHDAEVRVPIKGSEVLIGEGVIKGSEVLIGGQVASQATAQTIPIASVTYEALTRISLANGEQVPALDQVLVLAANRAMVYVEVKGVGIEQTVIECLARHPHTLFAVHSFDHRIPHTIRRRNAAIRGGILSSSYVLDLPHMLNSAGARDLWQHTALIDRELIETAHQFGAKVIAWTENNFAHAAEIVQMGVDAICTDIPGPMRESLTEAGLLTPVRAG